VLWRIFRTKRETGVKSSIICSLCHIISVIKSQRSRWAGHVANKAVIINDTIFLVRKPKWKRPTHSLEDDIKMDLERERN
jgi:hypothetical protein